MQNLPLTEVIQSGFAIVADETQETISHFVTDVIRHNN